MHIYNNVAQYQHGAIRAIRINIKVVEKQLDPCPHFTRRDVCSCLLLVDYIY